MKQALIFILFICSSAWSNVSLMAHLKKDEFEFPVTDECRTFIQESNHSTFNSPEIKKLLRPLKDLGFKNKEYFHYTYDLNGFIDRAVKAQDFTDILTYTMTYEYALNNEAGGGIYIAANPFSSSHYGDYQIIFDLSSKAKYFDLSEHKNAMDEVLETFLEKNTKANACPKKLITGLLWDGNDVDLVLYHPLYEWFVVLNESIFSNIRIKKINGSNQSEVIAKMFSNSDGKLLLKFLKEIQPTERHELVDLPTLIWYSPGSEAQKARTLITLMNQIVPWDKRLNHSLAYTIALFENPEFNRLKNHFLKQGRISKDLLLKMKTKEHVSESFIKWCKSLNP